MQWEYQRRAAERAVRWLAGVRGVINSIRIRPSVRPSPDQLTRQIQDALIRNAETDAQRISVETLGDKVILRGTVRSWAEKNEAERVAWSAPGVVEVENHITVSPAERGRCRIVALRHALRSVPLMDGPFPDDPPQ